MGLGLLDLIGSAAAAYPIAKNRKQYINEAKKLYQQAKKPFNMVYRKKYNPRKRKIGRALVRNTKRRMAYKARAKTFKGVRPLRKRLTAPCSRQILKYQDTFTTLDTAVDVANKFVVADIDQVEDSRTNRDSNIIMLRAWYFHAWLEWNINSTLTYANVKVWVVLDRSWGKTAPTDISDLQTGTNNKLVDFRDLDRELTHRYKILWSKHYVMTPGEKNVKKITFNKKMNHKINWDGTDGVTDLQHGQIYVFATSDVLAADYAPAFKVIQRIRWVDVDD